MWGCVYYHFINFIIDTFKCINRTYKLYTVRFWETVKFSPLDQAYGVSGVVPFPDAADGHFLEPQGVQPGSVVAKAIVC